MVAVDPGPPATLVIVEVRWRSRRDFGLPEETVGWRKRRGLRLALSALLTASRLPDGVSLPCLPGRVDLVAVEPPGAQEAGLRMRHYRHVGRG